MVAVPRRLTRSPGARAAAGRRVGAPARSGNGTPASREGAGVPASAAAEGRVRGAPSLAAIVAASLAIVASSLAVACAEPAPPPNVELEDGSVDLEPSVAVHEVALESTGGRPERMEPDFVAARAGDLVRFTSETLDSHALAFRLSRLDEAQRRFLEETGQEASAPLLERGHAWVLSLEGAPAGTYHLVCVIHEAAGRIDVAPAP